MARRSSPGFTRAELDAQLERRRERAVARQLAALEWITLNGKPAFRGELGGHRRLILGENTNELSALAEQMARGEA